MIDVITVVYDAKKFTELCIKAVHLRTSNHRHLIIDNGYLFCDGDACMRQ